MLLANNDVCRLAHYLAYILLEGNVPDAQATQHHLGMFRVIAVQELLPNGDQDSPTLRPADPRTRVPGVASCLPPYVAGARSAYSATLSNVRPVSMSSEV